MGKAVESKLLKCQIGNIGDLPKQRSESYFIILRQIYCWDRHQKFTPTFHLILSLAHFL